MTQPPSVAVQSVLYGNLPEDILRAAEALANSASWARERRAISAWSYLLGDSSPERALGADDVARIGRIIAASGGSFEYVFFGKNLGHGGGQNRLAERSSSELILILNPDGQLGPDAVGVLVDTVGNGVGAADARQVPFEHPKDYDPITGDASWSSGACLMTPREAFDGVGGFDHRTFFMYCDDVDYSWRLRLAGYRTVYAPSASLFHDKRLSLRGDMQAGEAEVYYSAEAALMLAYKYSRPDIVKSLVAAFARGDANAQRAAAEFARRRSDGELPRQLDADHRVGQFVKGNYAVHRF